MLKERLEGLDAAALSERELRNLAEAMLKEIGTADPYLRDDLIYSSFVYLIGDGKLSDGMLKEILSTCLDDGHLYYRLGAKEDNSVFTRSFSSLVMALIIQKDAAGRFLSEEEVLFTYQKTLDYIRRERDFRGYVKEKGWAHSTAHAADLLNELVRHPAVSSRGELLTKGMDVIFHCAARCEGVYIDDEFERLIFPLSAIIEKLDNEELLNFKLKQLSHKLAEARDCSVPGNSYYHFRTNVMLFYKTLYFRLVFIGIFPGSRELLEKKILEAHIKIYGENF
jgi:hypothetical protein